MGCPLLFQKCKRTLQSLFHPILGAGKNHEQG
ncbi:hypothetical protein HMPREF0178_00940, partial [Bilophila sp. 4_1_30]